MKKKYMICMLAVACFAGNSVASYADGETEEAVEMEEGSKEEYKCIGEKQDESYEVKLTNHTGKEITGIAVKETEEEEFPENMLEEEDTFAADEIRILYYTPEKEEESEEKTEEKLLEKGYDIELTFAEEEETVVLHSFPFEDLEEGEILVEEGIAYMKYTSKETEEEVSTLEAERMIAGVVQEEEGELVVYEGEAEPYYEEPVYEYTEPVYEYTEPVYEYTEPSYEYTEPSYEYTDPGYEAPAGDQGGDDACLGDGLFY